MKLIKANLICDFSFIDVSLGSVSTHLQIELDCLIWECPRNFLLIYYEGSIKIQKKVFNNKFKFLMS